MGVREQAGRRYKGVWCKCASCRWRGTWVRVWIHEQSNCINTSTNSRPSMADELGQHGSSTTTMVTTRKEDGEARLLTEGSRETTRGLAELGVSLIRAEHEVEEAEDAVEEDDRVALVPI